MNPDQRNLNAYAAGPQTTSVAMTGSPMAEALSTRLVHVDTDALLVEVTFEPRQAFTQAAGIVQGGAVAAMLDFVLAYAALLAVPEGQSVATATLNVSFLRPAPTGLLRARGRVERAGRSLVFTNAELRDSADRCVATASSSLPVVPWRS